VLLLQSLLFGTVFGFLEGNECYVSNVVFYNIDTVDHLPFVPDKKNWRRLCDDQP